MLAEGPHPLPSQPSLALTPLLEYSGKCFLFVTQEQDRWKFTNLKVAFKKIHTLCMSMCACVLSHFSRAQLFGALWTVARQAPMSMGFSRHNPHTEVGCHFLLQQSFPTQGSNLYLLCLLLWQVGSLPLVPRGKTHKHRLVKSGMIICMNRLIYALFDA